jgi:acetylornithine/succinyldiaminopimelate/putrescine aminotransferase
VITFCKVTYQWAQSALRSLGREELINPKVFPPGMTHSTFSSNPLGTAAGLATMELVTKNDFEAWSRRRCLPP